MPYVLLADLALLLHISFILFVVMGGLAVSRYPHLAWLHLPAVAWGGAVEFCGWFCPLTDLENYWRRLAGETGCPGSSFVDHYLTPLIYPDGLTRNAQFVLGLILLTINLTIYGWLLHRKKEHQARISRSRSAGPGE
jgi:hypothetical protein